MGQLNCILAGQGQPSNIDGTFSGIVITTKPTNMEAYLQQSYSPKGMVVAAQYKDDNGNIIQEIPISYGYRFKDSRENYPSSFNDTTLEIITDKATVTLDLNEIKDWINEISITWGINPASVEFRVGDNFILSKYTSKIEGTYIGSRETVILYDPTSTNEEINSLKNFKCKPTIFTNINDDAIGIYYAPSDYTADMQPISVASGLTVLKGQVIIPQQKGLPAYTGEPIFPEWSPLQNSLYTTKNNKSQINAGTYKTQFTLINPYDYEWEIDNNREDIEIDGSTVTVTWEIDKAERNIILSSNDRKIYSTLYTYTDKNGSETYFTLPDFNENTDYITCEKGTLPEDTYWYFESNTDQEYTSNGSNDYFYVLFDLLKQRIGISTNIISDDTTGIFQQDEIMIVVPEDNNHKKTEILIDITLAYIKWQISFTNRYEGNISLDTLPSYNKNFTTLLQEITISNQAWWQALSYLLNNNFISDLSTLIGALIYMPYEGDDDSGWGATNILLRCVHYKDNYLFFYTEELSPKTFKFSDGATKNVDWQTSDARAWCNSVFYNKCAAKESIKQVTKLTYDKSKLDGESGHTDNLIETEDYVWLPSEIELTFANGSPSQKEFTKNIEEKSSFAWQIGPSSPYSARLQKCLIDGDSVTYTNLVWWTRSPYKIEDNGMRKVVVINNGISNTASRNWTGARLSPTFVIGGDNS